MRIAVASKSGSEVDQHFGHAERFHIYEYRSSGSRLVDQVEVEKYGSFAKKLKRNNGQPLAR